MARRDLIQPTDDEDAAIRAGIAADPDTPEWTEAEFSAAVPFSDAGQALHQAVRRRGPQKTPTKRPVAIRLDQDVLEKFKATGRGWQTRINATLRSAQIVD